MVARTCCACMKKNSYFEKNLNCDNSRSNQMSFKDKIIEISPYVRTNVKLPYNISTMGVADLYFSSS